MKITVLLRYPRIENNAWKKELIEKLISQGNEVSIVFGESGFMRHFKAALKEYGTSFLKKKKKIGNAKGRVKLYNHFKNTLTVKKVDDLNSKAAEEIIKRIQPDYLLLLGTGIIRKNIFTIPDKGAVHCHHGHLPEYKGVSTAEWSIYHGDDVYITTHFVDSGVDTGDIILEKKIPLKNGDSIDDVRLRCRELSVELIEETFNLLQTGKATVKKQSQEGGRQFYFMHPFFKKLVEKKLTEVA